MPPAKVLFKQNYLTVELSNFTLRVNDGELRAENAKFSLDIADLLRTPVEPEPSTDDRGKWELLVLDAGSTRIKVIKFIREVTGLGLKEVKEVSEGTRPLLFEGSSAQYRNLAINLNDFGCQYTSKPLSMEPTSKRSQTFLDVLRQVIQNTNLKSEVEIGS